MRVEVGFPQAVRPDQVAGRRPPGFGQMRSADPIGKSPSFGEPAANRPASGRSCRLRIPQGADAPRSPSLYAPARSPIPVRPEP